MTVRLLGCAALSILAVFPLCGPLAGQERDWGAHGVDASREELDEVLSLFENAGRSRAYSPELRARALDEAGALRARLSEGDFRVGDRVVLMVEGEPALSDTFVVASDQTIDIPNVGEVSLKGVLRSELDSRLTDLISRQIHEPVVRARSFVRISFTGEVSSQGYFLLPPETPLTEAIMAVGGLTATASLSKVRVERGREVIWDGKPLQAALRQGLTLGALDMRSGDQVSVGRRSAFAAGEIGRTLLAVVSLITVLRLIF